MERKYCQECGSELVEKYLENEGMIPFCPECGQYRFPMYNVAVSMIVVNRKESPSSSLLRDTSAGRNHWNMQQPEKSGKKPE